MVNEVISSIWKTVVRQLSLAAPLDAYLNSGYTLGSLGGSLLSIAGRSGTDLLFIVLPKIESYRCSRPRA